MHHINFIGCLVHMPPALGGTCKECCACDGTGTRGVSQCKSCGWMRESCQFDPKTGDPIHCTYSAARPDCMAGCDAPGCPAEATQKRIWKQSGAASSSYVSSLASLTVRGGSGNRPPVGGIGVNWDQMSDRARAHVGTAYNPSRGNSTRASLVRHRPGAGGYAGRGVDVKHDSYARYLARRKARALATQPTSCDGAGPVSLPLWPPGRPRVRPIRGNKRRNIGMVGSALGYGGSNCCGRATGPEHV